MLILGSSCRSSSDMRSPSHLIISRLIANNLLKLLLILSSSLFFTSDNNFGVIEASFAPSGPTCMVTSLIPGSPQPTTSTMEGSCTSIISCRGIGGVPIGKCGLTNVCCVYPRTCDSRSNQNQTYFTNPGYPSPYNGTISCSIDIFRALTPYKICQIRLDFVDFELNRPTEGDCIMDRLVVSGQNANSVIPPICGRNTGQHMYMDVDGAQGPFTLRVLTSGPGYRRWNIRISQIECANPSRAPSNCLQYYMGPAGIFSSFNYESSRGNDLPINSNQQLLSLVPRDATYFNNMDYSICFRKEVGFCTQTYQVNTSYVPMEISAISPTNQQTFDSRVYGRAGATFCSYDYLLLDNIRYCGARLSPLGMTQQTDRDDPVFGQLMFRCIDAPDTNKCNIDRSSGPFIARFVSNEKYVGRGFQIGFQQNPCGARIPTDNPNFSQG